MNVPNWHDWWEKMKNVKKPIYLFTSFSTNTSWAQAPEYLLSPVPLCWHRQHDGQGSQGNWRSRKPIWIKPPKRSIKVRNLINPLPRIHFSQPPQSEKFDTWSIVKIFPGFVGSWKRRGWMMEEEEGLLKLSVRASKKLLKIQALRDVSQIFDTLGRVVAQMNINELWPTNTGT